MSSDEHFSFTTRIARPASAVFAWHAQPAALDRLCPPWEKVEVTESSKGIQNGAVVAVRNKVGPWWLNWTVEHRDYEAGRQFRDVQLSGPFARWEHLHRFEPDGENACRLTDEITYRLPAGGVGRAMGSGLVRRELSRLFTWRHATTKADLELSSPAPARAGQRILIAGASGVIGRTLIPFLRTQGHRIVRLVRRPARQSDEVYWNPEVGELGEMALEGIDAVINLSGENVAGGRWTEARRGAIFRSRVDSTRTLVGAIQRLQRKPAVLVSASAVGYYGDCGDEVLTEQSEIGTGFLPEVCLAWETHAEVARKAGVRTALVRFGVVLTPAGGALAKLLPVFRAGAGGPIGNGRQWMSWISIDDVVGGIYHALMRRELDGPVNVVVPGAVTNREFTKTLARVLRRPAILPVPSPVLRAVFGEMADATLLSSQRAVPERLLATG
ncbi:MAG TPA: TIGR01777 family oxidoreductase, partial [Opitutus sp.]|nr:TIGR01777 family oxidoreductase [Opitutus sp.]